MAKKDRRYFSVYFSDGCADNRKKGDVTLAFDAGDGLYNKCKKLGSSKIKGMIGITSYTELIEKAEKEDRPPSNYIKHHLKVAIANEKTDTAG